MKLIQRLFFSFVLFFMPFSSHALTDWQIVPEKSSITFTAQQNSSPVTGQFKVFTGEIHFDPNNLNDSVVNLMIDITSVTTSYAQIADTLKTSDWFNVKLFPHAVFKTNTFTKLSDNHYEVRGTLTLKDKTVPIILTFILEKYTATDALVKGSTILKRTAFDVGKGEWANTDAIKDDVSVSFVVLANKK